MEKIQTIAGWVQELVAAGPRSPEQLLGKRCSSCSKRVMSFCITCEAVVCKRCHGGRRSKHHVLRIVLTSREMSVKVKDIDRLVDVSDVHMYFFNEAFSVFLDRPAHRMKPRGRPKHCILCGRELKMGSVIHRTAPQLIDFESGKYKFCGIGCKMRFIEQHPQDGYTLSVNAHENGDVPLPEYRSDEDEGDESQQDENDQSEENDEEEDESMELGQSSASTSSGSKVEKGVKLGPLAKGTLSKFRDGRNVEGIELSLSLLGAGKRKVDKGPLPHGKLAKLRDSQDLEEIQLSLAPPSMANVYETKSFVEFSDNCNPWINIY
ncbi:hypothetical protein SELMODRAFT_414673 [Selaginella moellendorffii]|uniref:B box-type domain-containing protein n=1 Tax=Selaginella moellendorffii TaxID=88036 RepID=D8RTJ5_SELML|nr:hypothetical protein SELMODRAFT_414673 [Selaginella moellendorffii]